MSIGRSLFKIIAVLIGIILAWLLYNKFRDQSAPAFQMPNVAVEKVMPVDLPLTFEYAGRATGSRQIEIRARVSGTLLKRIYGEGQPVKQGDNLFKLDPAPFEAALDQAQAKLTQTEHNMQRAKSLLKDKAISALEYDERKSAYEQALAEVKIARINLGYTTITAPITGVTSKEGFSEGSLVTADTSVLTRIAQLDPIYIEFAIPDTQVLSQRQQIAAGLLTVPEDKKLQAEIHFEDGSIYEHYGTVNFIDNMIDLPTGTLTSRVEVPNPQGKLLPGQFLRVVIKGLTRKQAIVVPDQAIMQGPQGTFVYSVNNQGKVAIQPVTLGTLNGKKRLIEQGLKPGDQVIVEGMIKVRPDMPVSTTLSTPVTETSSSDSPSYRTQSAK
jgi:membrane fusion protein (multidrug efflux system)